MPFLLLREMPLLFLLILMTPILFKLMVFLLRLILVPMVYGPNTIICNGFLASILDIDVVSLIFQYLNIFLKVFICLVFFISRLCFVIFLVGCTVFFIAHLLPLSLEALHCNIRWFMTCKGLDFIMLWPILIFIGF